MMSGGDSAMVSPVTRIEHALFERAQESVEAASAGLPRNRLQLDRADQAEVAQIDHMRPALERVQSIGPVPADLLRACEQPLASIDLLGGDTGGARHRMRRVRIAVKELDRAVGPRHECLVDVAAHGDGAGRYRAVGHALGHRDHVRQDVEALRGERRAEPPETGDDLVEDQQDAVARADLAQPLEIAARRDQHARRARHRFDDHRGDRARIVECDQALELVGERRAVFGLAARPGIAGEVVCMRQMIDSGQLGREELAVVDHSADGNAAEAHAVVAALAADQPRARSLAPHAVPRERDLERGVDRFGSGIREEDVIDSRRQPPHDLVRQLEGCRVAHLERWRVIHRGDLAADGVRDLLAARDRR